MQEKIKVNGSKLKTLFVFICVAMLTILALVQTTFAKYVVKKELVVGVTTADYYFTAETDEIKKLLSREEITQK